MERGQQQVSVLLVSPIYCDKSTAEEGQMDLLQHGSSGREVSLDLAYAMQLSIKIEESMASIALS